MIEVQPDLDSTLRRRFAVPAEEARVRRTAVALEANGITVLRAGNGAEAKRVVLDLIPAGSQVHQGASQSLDAAGITDEIDRPGRHEPLRPRVFSMDRATQADQIRRLSASPDIMLGSVHAITETGTLVAASASGSQLGPYASGAGKVILPGWDAKDRARPRGRTAAHRRVRLPARGRACPGCLRHTQRRQQSSHHQSRVDTRPHHRRPLRRAAGVLANA